MKALIIAVFLLATFFSVSGGPTSNCSFYCFTTPGKNEKIDIAAYRRLHCTHFVYGYAEVERDNTLTNPSRYDLATHNGQGNYKIFTSLKMQNVKPLLGIRQKRSLTFIDNRFSRSKFAKLLVETARFYHFDGLFLYFDGDHYRSFLFERFLEEMTREVDLDAELKKTRLFMVLAIPAARIDKAFPRLTRIHPHFDAIYLVTDDIPSMNNPLVARHLAPLYPSAVVPKGDSLSINAEGLVKADVPSNKIVIGLSIWGRSYEMEDPTNVGHGNSAIGFGPSTKLSKRRDGRLAYGDLCQLVENNENLVYDATAVTLSFADNKSIWYSFEKPKHESFDRKLEWISSHGFGGIGLSSFQADDVSGICGTGHTPFHQYVSKRFNCRAYKHVPSTEGCTRICVIQPERSAYRFRLANLKPTWCSHLIISTAIVEAGKVTISPKTKAILNDYNTWVSEMKPLLILSVGGNLSSAAWRSELSTSRSIDSLIHQISDLIQDFNADGVEIEWTKETMEGEIDRESLLKFLNNLRSKVKTSSLILLAVHPKSAAKRLYDINAINKNVDLIIIDGHRMQDDRMQDEQVHLAGHHSTMFGNHELLPNRAMTMESIANDWVSLAVNRSKLIIGLSAEGHVQRLLTPESDAKLYKSYVLPFDHREQNSLEFIISQSEICALRLNKSVITNFVEGIGVPYMIDDSRFISYDDVQSTRIKATWSSLNRFGGIAIYGLELDDPEGKCGSNRSFPILRSIVETQVCKQCPNTTNSPCNPGMRIACSYRLPDDNDKDPLHAETLPFEKCTEIVVEEAIMDKNGDVTYRDTSATLNMHDLLRHMPKIGQRGFISSVQCSMTQNDFSRIVGQPKSLINKLVKHLEMFNFSGIELKCDHLLTPRSKSEFTVVLNGLAERLKLAQVPGRCPKTISLRVPAWQKKLKDNYDISTLNKLHHVVLEPFLRRQKDNITQLSSPLFPADYDDEALSVSSTVKSWVADGLKKASILLDISTYGVAQKLASASHQLSDRNRPHGERIVPYKDMCRIGGRRQLSFQTVYGMVAAHTTTGNEWITVDTQQTIEYKVRYAIREGLAGVGIMTVNEDDFKNRCSQGHFPLLSSIVDILRSCN